MRHFDPRKIRERRHIARLAKQARANAHRDAFDLCSTVGPAAISEEYDIATTDGVPVFDTDVVARRYAEQAYVKQVWDSATSGAKDGFEQYLAAP